MTGCLHSCDSSSGYPARSKEGDGTVRPPCGGHSPGNPEVEMSSVMVQASSFLVQSQSLGFAISASENLGPGEHAWVTMGFGFSALCLPTWWAAAKLGRESVPIKDLVNKDMTSLLLKQKYSSPQGVGGLQAFWVMRLSRRIRG